MPRPDLTEEQARDIARGLQMYVFGLSGDPDSPIRQLLGPMESSSFEHRFGVWRDSRVKLIDSIVDLLMDRVSFKTETVLKAYTE